jgi:hypothetical protein
MACKHWQEGPTDAPPAATSHQQLRLAQTQTEDFPCPVYPIRCRPPSGAGVPTPLLGAPPTGGTHFESQGGSSQFPGVLVGTPHVRKCHQMSSKEHIQPGWVVRWVLSTPPGHPAARRCVRVVPVLPLLLCTRPARARHSVGGQSPTPAPR